MQDNFASSLKHVLVYEGGKVDHPKDPGGRTNQGVTQRVYTAYRRRKGLGERDVWTMAPAERDEIYDAQYWDAVKADKLPLGIDFVVFDGAVHSGPAQSVKWLQRAVGVKADGIVGQLTLEAIAAHPDHDRLVDAILERRLGFLRELKTWGTFGKGWRSRIEQVRATGQAMAMGSVGPAPVYVPSGAVKATVDDANTAPATAPSDAAAGGAIGIGALLAAFKAQIEPYVGVLPHLDQVVAVIAVGSAVVTLGAGVYSWWARRRAAQIADALNTGVPA